jgi:3-hydroxyisobutyrate dehydrogenase-like beta-hydroxyacid dehydrogenase
MRVTFIGLGNMGQPLARHLLNAGFELSVFNRTVRKGDALVQAGAQRADSPLCAARASNCLVTMLADDQALNAVMDGDDGALAGLPQGGLHVSMSTISVARSQRLEEQHAQAGVDYVAAPVFGRPEAAQAKKLGILAAGKPAAIERARPLLEAMSPSVIEVGDAPPLANTVKLAGNLMIAAMLETLGECFALARKSGLSRQRFLEIVNGAVFKSPVYENYGMMIANNQFDPAGFPLNMGLKDMRLLLEAARETVTPMPMASLIHDHALGGIARGWGGLDWSALAKISADSAGLDSSSRTSGSA